MSQLNVHLTPAFDKALRKFMRLRGLKNKSEAVRLAVQEALERASRSGTHCDFASWRGMALEPAPNPKPRFSSEDDLWS